jgi:S-DNA-T family DNA segregation ATPase FtsK/SpoIIIE
VVGTLPATPEYLFIVIMVDEIAFLTAYQPTPKLRDRIKAALATLTTQGRAAPTLICRGGSG